MQQPTQNPRLKLRIPPRWRPNTIRGRLIFGLAVFLGGLVFAVAVIVGSVWIENKFPSDDKKRALLPGAQRLVTKPIVSALSRQIEQHIKREAEAIYMNTGLTVEETIARFLDERVDLAERRVYSYRLARLGTPESIAALLKVFQTAPLEHKVFMAQLIGSTGNPAAKEWLWPLLEDGDRRVVVAGIRALCAMGGEDVTARIAKILADGQTAEQVRVEAALGLGTIGTPTARVALVGMFQQKPSAELTAQILNSLGQFEFPTVAATFEQYLAAPETTRELRATAAEALAHSSAEAVPFLLELARGDGDADVRAASAWAISTHDAVSGLGAALTDLTGREPEVDVRRRLYEALLPQNQIPAERLLPTVQAERDIAARVAGFNAIGRAAKQLPTSSITAAFDNEIVPELVQIATSKNSVNIQMRAVFALRRAQTPAALEALAAIANSANPQVAAAARNGLRAGKT